MNIQTIKLTYDEIDKLLESMDKDLTKDIKWKYVTENELESLLKNP